MVIPDTWEAEIELQLHGQNCELISEKQTTSKRTGGMAQVVEHLASKYKAPSSIPSIGGKKCT
jgi:hypothetical protein